MTLDVLSEVMRAADYMEVEPLLDLVCLKYTFLIVGTDDTKVSDMDRVEEGVASLDRGCSCICNVRLVQNPTTSPLTCFVALTSGGT
jgi:hypothetical protein